MKVYKTIAETRKQVKDWQKEGLSVGFVPTMGFLHQGHGSLMAQARKENDKVVVSIFVNPTQFAVGEDLESYPRDFQGDSALCEKEGVDLIFAPSVEEMYPEPSNTAVTMENLSEELCGKSRPTHFSGVCLVVSKLFHIVPADKSYFGQKDAQQLAIIRKMVVDLNMDMEVIGCPIVRESDGLALSSRNSYLGEEQRKAAVILSKTLQKVKEMIEEGEKNGDTLRQFMASSIAEEPLAQLDYAEIVDSIHLKPVSKLEHRVLIALAVYFGKTRLIDNITVNMEE